MSEGERITALAEAVRNTGTELQSIGGKLHLLADALGNEVDILTSTIATLQSDLAVALTALEQEKAKDKTPKSSPLNLDICLGIRANGNTATSSFRRLECCTGCGGGGTPSPPPPSSSSSSSSALTIAAPAGAGAGAGSKAGSAVAGGGAGSAAEEARSQLSKALSEVAARAEAAVAQARTKASAGGSRAGSVGGWGGGGSGSGKGKERSAASRLSSSHASQK